MNNNVTLAAARTRVNAQNLMNVAILTCVNATKPFLSEGGHGPRESVLPAPGGGRWPGAARAWAAPGGSHIRTARNGTPRALFGDAVSRIQHGRNRR